MSKIFHAEGVHSDMLAWFLTPNEWHGLSDTFATALIHDVFTRCGLPGTEQIRVQRVHREYSTGNGPIDILVEGTRDGAKFILGIENKNLVAGIRNADVQVLQRSAVTRARP